MKKARSTLLVVAAIMLLAIVATPSSATPKRREISLDGTWRVTQAALSDTVPTTFERTIPVPGLVDMASPPFANANPGKQAFWYQRSFTVAGPKSPVAVLKIRKAQFGAKVWVNGTPVGEHFGCFTPGYFDVSKLIRYGGKNTLIVRIGATKDCVPDTIPTGTDPEKGIWTPGIYDSVTLILSGIPRITSLQVAPVIGERSVIVQASVKGLGHPAMTFAIREWKSGRRVRGRITRLARVSHAGEQLITATIRFRRPRLWSPENPFLYVLRCETSGDRVEMRFGMREFRYNPATGLAELNGKPYFLRGTNFCMFRFFEDPRRGGLPWDREWARKLLAQPKTLLHWNSARVCIAPLPEFWYDLADELGWLLQDEYPIWGFSESWSQKELETEFSEWLHERWNHPSIVVWDACNETLTPRTSKLIEASRRLDISNRPWDNGYSPRARPSDAIEVHPYMNLSSWTGEAAALGSPLSKRGRVLGVPPVILNEYDAFWMQRDGGDTTSFGPFYKEKLGGSTTPAQRREFLAYQAGAITEYWRARRPAGLQWFCYLTYSMPGRVTSDNFADLQTATLEPRFVDYMRNAFSPLAVMIDEFETEFTPGSGRVFRIIITNDLDQRRRGTLSLKLKSRDGKLIYAERHCNFSVKALGQTVRDLAISIPAKPGEYRLVAELAPTQGERVLSRRRVILLSPEELRKMASLSDHCPVTASSEFPGCPARLAVDTKRFTRWSSKFSDPQWIMVDLRKPQRIARVTLDWEIAYAKAYKVQVSNDVKQWAEVYSTENGKGGHEEITFTPVTARYVRVYGTARATVYGYSLWSLRVLGDGD